MAAKDSREVALIGEAARRRDLRQSLPGINQGPARHSQPELAQVVLRRQVETKMELALERSDRHVGDPGELSIRDRPMIVIAHERQDRPKLRARGDRQPGRVQPSSDSRRADDQPVVVDQRDLVGDVPNRQSVGLADQLDPVDDLPSRQHILVVEAELIGEESRRQVVVGLTDDVPRVGTRPAAAVIERVVDEESPIDPLIPPGLILDPDLDVVHTVE